MPQHSKEANGQTGRRTWNEKCPTQWLGIRKRRLPGTFPVQVSNAGRWTLDAGRWTLDAGRWTLDAGRWTLDVHDVGLMPQGHSHATEARPLLLSENPTYDAGLVSG